MMKSMNRILRGLLLKLGYDVVNVRARENQFPPDFDDSCINLVREVRPFTMTSAERIFALRESVEYIVANSIPGDIVECGVWRGGSMMVVARTLVELGATDRFLNLFDTFEGMSEPTAADRTLLDNTSAELTMREKEENNEKWCYCPVDDVKKNVFSTGYNANQVRFIKGRVEETLPEHAPDKIALLRLDTDWYESTYHGLVHLYPRLSVGGVLIIDDYGHWAGAKKAVDQYIADNGLPLLLNRVDNTGRVGQKLAA